jgi:predicted aspartyl protease
MGGNRIANPEDSMKERKKSKFLTYSAALLGGLSWFTSAQTLAASIVKFKLLHGYMIVTPVTVNGAGPYEFLLDTGSNTTFIDAEFARALRLRPIDRVELMTVAGSQIVPRARLESVAIGAKSAADVEAVFSDLRKARAISPEICGVLGQNFLSRFNYLINYRERRIEFEDGGELDKSLCGERTPVELREGRALITSAGRERLQLVLDSGTPALILFDAQARVSGLYQEPGDPKTSRLSSNLGSQVVWQRRLRNFSVGGVEFHDLRVTLCEAEGGCAGRVEDGLLPTSLFQNIYFNHRKKFVMLNPKTSE